MSLRKAFTLVEILIVVIILGILAAAIVPQFTSAADESRTNSAAMVAKSAMRKVSAEKARSGTYPTAITADMFEGGTLPRNPLFPDVTDTQFQIETNGDLLHPKVKTGSGSEVWWYNSGNGVFRVLIPDTGTKQEKIDQYNAANNTSVTSLNQTK